ncbi:hypothetical protein GGX14DRAFT_412337 [Mycena pura]|uniref:SET domain-containing protein n=1 Tax=Mycena pura TaxID=153505 RepID=A0AAD7E506_9AGAR|nr:hypothetical protein GGX14DRAFT_412337 [Mycena pura]
MTSRTGTILTIAGVSVCGLIAYAVYFDFKRRTDSNFRKKLREQKKRVDKSLAQSKEASATSNVVSDDELRDALKQIESEPKPPTQERREHYFMSQVAMGEQLVARGETFHLPAALSFYRALLVYPSPPELLGIYRKTVPEDVVKLVMRLLDLDLTTKIGAYYEVFPPKWANVSIQSRPETVTSGPEKVLVLNKDVAAGEVIYKEHPMLTCLDYDLQQAGTHCTHCLREIQPSMESFSLLSSNGAKSVFCSTPCQVASKTQWHSLLLTLEPPMPAIRELSVLTDTPAQLEARRTAQAKLVAYLKDKRAGTMLVAKFIARQLTATATEATAKDPNDYAAPDSGEYRIEDHVERWTTGPVNPPSDEYALISALLQGTLPGLEQFLTEESHKSLLGKIVFNAFGVYYGGGRDNRPPSPLRPEDGELTRTPHGTARQVGTALYSISTYLPHSCTPNARPTFSGTAELHLIANKDLKKGDELSIAYVDVEQRAGESSMECRLRRRKELARGWKFPCECPRCVMDAFE